MAFPTIQTADTKNGTVTSNSTSWTITYCTNIAAGDLLLLFLANDGTAAFSSLPSNWGGPSAIPIVNTFTSGANSLSVWAKKALGTETGTFTATCGASEQGGWRMFRITGWFGGNPFYSSPGANDSDSVSSTTSLNFGTDNHPDPLSEDPSTWVTEDTLWIAACSLDTSRTISAYPLAGNNTADVSGGAGGATLGICTTTSAVASLDVGQFTISASDDWVAATVAVRPATSAYQPRHPGINHQNPALL